MLTPLRFLTLFILTLLSFSLSPAATFTVTKTADTNDNVCNADCSLREAMTLANLNGAGADTIVFDIPGSGVKTIALASELPQIETSLTINGATQTGYFGKPLIEVNGDAAFDSFGFDIGTPAPFADISVTILAIALTHHTYGVYSRCAPTYKCDITLLGNFIGTTPAGTAAAPNRTGVFIQPSSNSTIKIGGSGLFEGNLISGNNGATDTSGGIVMYYGTSQFFHDNVTIDILGNKIGTNFSGDAALPNSGHGILISEFAYQGSDSGDFKLTIGGTTAPARNVISGNGENGVELRVDDATVQGNYIGTNAAGTAALPNGDANGFFSNYGVLIQAQDGGTYRIGTPVEGGGNLISGNNGDGIYVSTGAGGSGNAALDVENNLIGTNAAGTAALGNDGDGVSVSSSTNYTVTGQIGGISAFSRNVISGNNASGIAIASGNISIWRNYIGTDKTGNSAIGNDYAGILVTYDGFVKIGGTVQQNGTNYDGGNVISGNDGDGIRVPGFANFPVDVKRNRIGTNAGATAAVPNTGNGITLGNASSIVGTGTNPVDSNVISGNGANGILIDGNGGNASDTKVYRNYIGTDGAGAVAVPNGQNGVKIDNSPNNRIGLGNVSVTTNVISGNGASGILITGGGSSGNIVENNVIGAGVVGNDVGNAGSGVEIFAGSENFIGSTNGAANAIAFNAKGVWVRSGTDNEIRRNAIFSNDALGIDLDAAGITPNDAGDLDTGANRKQNFPVIERATPAGVTGKLSSTPNANFTLDFYRVDSCDASGNGEGRYYLGSTFVVADGTGVVDFNYAGALSVGEFVTATATVTDIFGADDTSEFSNCMAVAPTPTVQFSVAAYSANEGAGQRTIVVTRAGATAGSVSVKYDTWNGTAIANQDYTEQHGTLVFGDGETIKTFDIPITNDTLDEDDETIELELSFPGGGASLGTPSASVLTIVDNDNPPSISIADVTKAEGNGGMTNFTFDVSLSTQSGKTVTVDFATADGTADLGDYVGLSGQVTFPAFQTLKQVTVSVIGDTTEEPDQTFFVNLANAVNATLADAQGTGTIQNDDSQLKIRGTVRLADLTPVPNVAVQLAGSLAAQVTTDASGRYAFDGLPPNGNFTVSPSLANYTFSPVNYQFSNLGANVSDADFTALPAPARQLQIISGVASPGQNGTITVELVAQGNENSVAFSLDYNPLLLNNPQIAPGSGAPGASLVTDTSVSGKIGIHVALPAGQTFPAGTRQLAKVTFSTAQTSGMVVPIAFVDTPMARQILDAQAADVTANYLNGQISILAPTSANVSVGGRVRDASGSPIPGVRVTLVGADGQTRKATTNGFGFYRFDEVAAGETYLVSVSHRRYAFAEPTRIVNVQEARDDLDFVSQN